MPIHDHVYSFTSHVLHGAIENVTYDVVPTHADPSAGPCAFFRIWRVACWQAVKGHSPLEPTDGLYEVSPRLVERVEAGRSYSFEALEFHETRAPVLPAITVVRLSPLIPGVSARVMAPAGAVPDPGQRRDLIPVPVLWSMVEEVLKQARPAITTP